MSSDLSINFRKQRIWSKNCRV